MPDSIEEFPTANQTVLDTVMKDMLISLRSSLQADMVCCMHKLNKELGEVEARVEQVEFDPPLMMWWMPRRKKMRRWSGSKPN